MKRLLVILVVVLLATSVAGAEITASLEVVAGQDAAVGSYRRAELTVTNSAAAPVETVLLKPAGVGLTVRYKLTVPPGSDGKQTVSLPAVSPTQEYVLTALDASGEVVGRTSASITWPAELVVTDAFIDDAFKSWADEPARWSAKTRRNYLLVLAMFVVAAAATLFIRRGLLRAGAILVIAAAAAALLVFVFIPAGPEAVQVHRYSLLLDDGVGGRQSDSFAVLSARRTTKWSGKIFEHPVYADREAAADDETLVEPATGTTYMTLHPGQVRIIRSATEGKDLIRFPAEAIWPQRGTARREVDGFTIEADFIRQGWLVIRDDSVWLLGQDAGGQKVPLRNDQAQSYWAFMSNEGGKGLGRHARRLLNYWRNKHQQAGRVYLVEPHGDEAGAHIVVVQLKQAPSEITTTSAPVTTHPLDPQIPR